MPIVFFQEAHRRDLVDFGRELDGAEGIHLLEGNPGTDIADTDVCVHYTFVDGHQHDDPERAGPPPTGMR